MQTFGGLLLSMILAIVIGTFYIPLLRRKKVGQNIREDGPKSHYAKAGTPTMGGVSFIVAILITVLVTGNTDRVSMLVVLGMLLFGAIGFVDDYMKIVMKRSLGLNAKQKLVLQLVFSVIMVVLIRVLMKANFLQLIPFRHEPFSFWLFIYPILVFVIIGVVNAVNLTDGLDGLAGGVSLPVFLTYAIILFMQGKAPAIALIIAGGIMGFLFFNAHPASVYMGDTGSMALGGAVVVLAILTDTVFYLPILGGIFLIETLSVIIQTLYFRRTGGKRIFRMSPIHHHFELGGHKETKIVSAFTMVSIALAMATLWIYTGSIA